MNPKGRPFVAIVLLVGAAVVAPLAACRILVPWPAGKSNYKYVVKKPH